VALFFERGKFTHQDTLMTTHALWAYATGLVSFSMIRVLVSGFFALKDTKTPVYVATMALLLNFLSGLLLMRVMGHSGLALSLTIASTFQVIILFVLLQKKVGGLTLGPIRACFLKSAASSLAMGLAVWAMGGILPFHGGLGQQLLRVFLLVFSGTFFYILLAYAMKAEELKFFKIS
jgi:putative peptidoglycan lipid II flippase